MLIRCKVTIQVGGNCWDIRFPDYPGRSLYFQSQKEQAEFAHACGKCGPEDEGYPGFEDVDPYSITECPDDYLEIADTDSPNSKGEA